MDLPGPALHLVTASRELRNGTTNYEFIGPSSVPVRPCTVSVVVENPQYYISFAYNLSLNLNCLNEPCTDILNLDTEENFNHAENIFQGIQVIVNGHLN